MSARDHSEKSSSEISSASSAQDSSDSGSEMVKSEYFSLLFFPPPFSYLIPLQQKPVAHDASEPLQHVRRPEKKLLHENLVRAFSKPCQRDRCLVDFSNVDRDADVKAMTLRREYWALPSEIERSIWILHRLSKLLLPSFCAQLCNEGFRRLVGFSSNKEARFRSFLKKTNGDVSAATTALYEFNNRISVVQSLSDTCALNFKTGC